MVVPACNSGGKDNQECLKFRASLVYTEFPGSPSCIVRPQMVGRENAILKGVLEEGATLRIPTHRF